MINHFGSESHGGHLGIARVLAKLWFARERLRKFWGLMAAWRRNKKEDRVLMQNHSSAYQGADHGCVVRRCLRASGRLAISCLSCSHRREPAVQGGNYGWGHRRP